MKKNIGCLFSYSYISSKAVLSKYCKQTGIRRILPSPTQTHRRQNMMPLTNGTMSTIVSSLYFKILHFLKRAETIGNINVCKIPQALAQSQTMQIFFQLFPE